MSLPDGYYALHDPDDPTTMTYWRQHTDAHGPALVSWPRGALYGPTYLRRDVPKDREERIEFGRQFQARLSAWMGKARSALTADPDTARARFAVWQIRCCVCGRTLRDRKSKVLGIGPDCRRGEDEAALAAILTPLVAQAHAEHLAAGSVS